MKILMLNYEFPPIGGGASPVSYDIGRGLAAKGHHVTVVTMAFRDLPGYEQTDGMEIFRVKCWRTQKMVCHPWEQATYILSAIRFMKQQFKQGEFDICLCHFIIPTGVAAWWLKRKYQLPYVITSHGSDVIGHNNKRFKWLYLAVRKPWRAITRGAAAVVAPSRYLKELIERTEPDAKVIVIRNGVDSAFFRRTKEKKKSILVMCRLQETKNVQCILNALPMVDMRDWRVDILGDGPCRERLEKLAEENGLEDKVIFRGWVPNKSEGHLRYLQEAAVYLSASRVENCPTSILEALSCGANVLLSDIPAHRQLVEEIDDKVFFENDNVKELGKKLQELIDHIESRGQMDNSYDLGGFAWESSIGKYSVILEKSKQ